MLGGCEKKDAKLQNYRKELWRRAQSIWSGFLISDELIQKKMLRNWDQISGAQVPSFSEKLGTETMQE